ncbi:hypothetical protein BC938DRAFT_483454 [Jimgerdemannia flammicorona]|uniref:Uncharacterized protein n=1 Tax=Jimgerdemannia flammicorona TaxID=994334 RepID=A0A433QBW8_9FUNG|nr:hypothetical protein BC938DRAFT_483454 [Jimgerdemannia flammicorona]
MSFGFWQTPSRRWTAALRRWPSCSESPSKPKEGPEIVKQWFENAKQRWLLVFDNADDRLDFGYILRLENGDVILTLSSTTTYLLSILMR